MNLFACDVRGGIMFAFALVFPVMLLGVGAAIDYGQLYAKRTTLQGAADASALTAAHGLRLANADESEVEAVAESAAMANLAEMPGTVGISVAVTANPPSVTVELSQTPGLYFMDTLTGNKDTVIKARATAQVAGSTPLCALGLDESSSNTISLEKAARMSAPKCAVYSNSVNRRGIYIKDSAAIEAGLICSVGGADGNKGSYNPSPLSDCPKIDDPLKSRTPPLVGKCDFDDLRIKGKTATLMPGVYCGGLDIENGSNVNLRPGIYVIKDGDLRVKDSVLAGENVGFYLIGKGATFSFEANSTIRLTAPNNGDMAGLLFFEDRNSKLYQKHKILSNDARLLLGTIYLPRGRLYIEAKKAIADESAYTIIITQQFELTAGPTLVLNSNYEDADVQLPSELEDVSTAGDHIVLSK